MLSTLRQMESNRSKQQRDLQRTWQVFAGGRAADFGRRARSRRPCSQCRRRTPTARLPGAQQDCRKAPMAAARAPYQPCNVSENICARGDATVYPDFTAKSIIDLSVENIRPRPELPPWESRQGDQRLHRQGRKPTCPLRSGGLRRSGKGHSPLPTHRMNMFRGGDQLVPQQENAAGPAGRYSGPPQ